MPHLRVRGLKKEELIKVSKNLIEKLSQTMESPKSSFTLEHIPSTYISDGDEVLAKHIFLEIYWFSRDDNTKQNVADIVTSVLAEDNQRDLAVYFIDMKKDNYFKNGVHF